MKKISPTPRAPGRARVGRILKAAAQRRIVVLGDLILDHYLWGKVGRISPEAPVPVVEFERESFIAGGAGNVARNLADLGVKTEVFGAVGRDGPADLLRQVLAHDHIGCGGLAACAGRMTSVKTRIIAHRQQVVRLDRETRAPLNESVAEELLKEFEVALAGADAVILGDYAKGVLTQKVLDRVKHLCRTRGLWLSVDPKPSHALDLSHVSLLTPNRKEAFELARLTDEQGGPPSEDPVLMDVAERLLRDLAPAVLLITLGEHGMLLCERGLPPFHIPTVAREVFDVSGAGDTVVATFTLAIAAGASPVEAAILSNHAAGIVVGKLGTATVRREELLNSFGDGKIS